MQSVKGVWSWRKCLINKTYSHCNKKKTTVTIHHTERMKSPASGFNLQNSPCYSLFMYYKMLEVLSATPSTVTRPVPPVHPHHHPHSYLFTLTWGKENVCMGILTLDNISSPDSPYVHHVPAFSKINQNRPFCSVECSGQSVGPSLPWTGQLSLFFKLKHDLLWILTCDKLYTLLIMCQLERWSCAF